MKWMVAQAKAHFSEREQCWHLIKKNGMPEGEAVQRGHFLKSGGGQIKDRFFKGSAVSALLLLPSETTIELFPSKS